jgi:hypothetical protein
MNLKLTTKELKMLLMGFLLGMIAVLALMRIVDYTSEVDYSSVSLEELEQTSNDDQLFQDTASKSVDQADLESF